MKPILDLRRPEHSYFLGLVQTDGHVEEGTRNRSKVKIELNRRDRSILSRLHDSLPLKSSLSDRDRVTNFGPSSTSTLTICSHAFTNEIKSYGIPAGRKSDYVTCPSCPHSETDYWRGIIDGDGSLGVTTNSFPFLSLVTKSNGLAASFLNLIEKVTGQQKHSNRNKRDAVFNIAIFKENAQKMISHLYYPGAFCMDRKRRLAEEALLWVRPAKMKIVSNRKAWNKEEDDVVRSMQPEYAAQYLGRTIRSIRSRRWRLHETTL